MLCRRHFTAGLLASTAMAGLCGCSVNPATGQSSFTAFMSEEEERKIGREELPKMLREMGGEYRDKKIANYVNAIGHNLAQRTEKPDLPYTFTVLNSEIVNAFALPGGPVCISRGLIALASDEAELAGVIGHELGHVNARHSAQRYSKAMAANIGLGVASIGLAILGAGALGSNVVEMAQYGAAAYLQAYSREHEMEADQLGVRYMTRAGYNPKAMVRFLDKLRQHSILEARMAGRPESSVDEYHMMSTHPRTLDRVQKAQATAEIAMPPDARLNREAYLDHVNGLLFGDDPEQGMLKNRRFIHPGLRFQFDVPPGFRVNNTPSAIVGRHPEGVVFVFDGAKQRQTGDMRAYLTREWAPQAQLAGLEATRINTLEAATATTRAHTKNNQTIAIRLVAIRGDQGDVFRFMLMAPLAKAGALDGDLRRMAYSFTRISQAEAALVKPLRLIVAPAREGDTPQKLAASLPFEQFNADWFRLLNDLEPGQALPVGKPIKVVAG
ncbi:MAG: M48 family metalloprotease [Rhodospirillales bacterium]|nr:M48 family metalloprotease [Rhodospirillales bacterium]